MPSPRKKRALVSRTLIITGIILIVIALLMEGQRYPWGTLFGFLAVEESTLPDPAPIILKGADADSTLVEYTGNEPFDPAADQEIRINILPGAETGAPPPPIYIRLGIIQIPKLGVSEHILEGIDRHLYYGVGHVPGTGSIDASGNCVLAGHRYAGFRHLDKLVAGDTLVLKAGENTYNYSVYDSFEVLPEETWVLSTVEEGEKSLTLITCTPYLISTHRLIIRAHLTAIDGIPGEN